jgi:glycosyltransferase involved in cell wall biosynthesis
MKVAIIIAFNAWNSFVTEETIKFLKSVIEKTVYPDYEIILFENNSKPELLKMVTDYLEDLKRNRKLHNCKKVILINPIVDSEKYWWYNMSREYNDAIQFTDAKVLAFMNNDMEVVNEYWLSNCVRRLYGDGNGDGGENNIGMICPHTTMTYGDIIGCNDCSLRNGSEPYVCLFTNGCLKRYQPQEKVWFREWSPMGAYVMRRDVLERVKMHDARVDLHSQDLSIIFRCEIAGYKTAVAMDSLVEHYHGNGHLTLDFIALNGTDDYNNRAIHSYKIICDCINDNPKLAILHSGLDIAMRKWYNDYWMMYNKEKMDSYNKWVEEHNNEWKNTNLNELLGKVRILTYE